MMNSSSSSLGGGAGGMNMSTNNMSGGGGGNTYSKHMEEIIRERALKFHANIADLKVNENDDKLAVAVDINKNYEQH